MIVSERDSLVDSRHGMSPASCNRANSINDANSRNSAPISPSYTLSPRFSLEICRAVVHYASRSELPALCRVSKEFQNAGERALYNTVFVRDDDIDEEILHSPGADVQNDEEGKTGWDSGGWHGGREGVHFKLVTRKRERWRMLCQTLARTPRVALLVDALTVAGDASDTSGATGHGRDFWTEVSSALKATTRLKHLNIHVLNSGFTRPMSLAGTRPGSHAGTRPGP